jgi:8-oxo-dGTP diphosphatase
MSPLFQIRLRILPITRRRILMKNSETGKAGYAGDRVQYSKEVVVVIPLCDDKVMMQLRDDKLGIIFPGQWGFFSGSLEKGEAPEEGARRELLEELGIETIKMTKLHARIIPELNDMLAHAFYFDLQVEPENIVLREGWDMGLFQMSDVLNKHLFSAKLNQYKEVIPLEYNPSTIKELMALHNVK